MTPQEVNRNLKALDDRLATIQERLRRVIRAARQFGRHEMAKSLEQKLLNVDAIREKVEAAL